MKLRLVMVVALVLAACAEPASQPVAPSVTEPPSPTSAPSTTLGDTTTTSQPTSSSTETTRPAPNPDRPLAPDFSLTLSDGTEYQLANETRPVYLVFWAEW